MSVDRRQTRPPLTGWSEVLHDHDFAEVIVDRVLENGCLLLLDRPSYRTRNLDLHTGDTYHARHRTDYTMSVSGFHRSNSLACVYAHSRARQVQLSRLRHSAHDPELMRSGSS